jgi:hypothetical protein
MAVFLHFHAQVWRISLGPYDTVISISGLLTIGAGLFALVRLRGVDAQRVQEK